jgi:hypothetical protein
MAPHNLSTRSCVCTFLGVYNDCFWQDIGPIEAREKWEDLHFHEDVRRRGE